MPLHLLVSQSLLTSTWEAVVMDLYHLCCRSPCAML